MVTWKHFKETSMRHVDRLAHRLVAFDPLLSLWLGFASGWIAACVLLGVLA